MKEAAWRADSKDWKKAGRMDHQMAGMKAEIWVAEKAGPTVDCWVGSRAAWTVGELAAKLG